METSKSQEWTLLTQTIFRLQEWMHQTLLLTISISQEWMWTFKSHKLLKNIDPKISPTNPDPIEPATVHQADVEVEPTPVIYKVDPELRRSSRVRTQTEKYTPSMSGSKYSYAVTHMKAKD